ncbi:sodium:solute symporter [Pollutibacter soli]|uniref:sodium:solute symporter n=1 Tax=Pollutibacter soli TaxID=3034157 RepID=UPI0030133994
MSATLLFSFVIGYFLLLLGVAWFTSRNATNDSFFIGNKSSNWVLVSFGMIGTSLSGVTFVSVPGTVGDFTGGTFKAFSYFQVVIGYLFGYAVIAYVLIPLYYKMNLTSIYNYLEHRFGTFSYKTGALFFLISRTVGATARLYLVINVLQIFILDRLGVPFTVTAFVILLMILLYTFEGGVKTIVYTDTLQTTFMLLGLVVCIVYILNNLNLGFGEAMQLMSDKGYTRIFDTDVNSRTFFLKSIIGGAFIAIAMTGLDQEMMQKNISVNTLKNSQKNIKSFTVVMVIVTLLFLVLGGLLYLFMLSRNAQYEGTTFLANGKNIIGDDLFPSAAMFEMPQAIGIIFIIGLISALFPSADGALTALTSSFCIDILGLKRNQQITEQQRKRTRMIVHLSFTVIFMLCILIFKWINNKSIINIVLDLAGYTYGPLLGLFTFGILTKRRLNDSIRVTLICLVAPVLCYILSRNAADWFGGYRIGIELLIINGLLTFAGLWLISSPSAKNTN